MLQDTVYQQQTFYKTLTINDSITVIKMCNKFGN